MSSSTGQQRVPIAIVGMGCRYPGKANSPEALWKLVSEGRDAYSEVPEDRFNFKAFHHPDTEGRGTINQKGGHFLDQSLDAFDAGFFGVPPREAECMDAQQRVILEASWEAAENSGIPMDEFKGSDTAVFGECCSISSLRPMLRTRKLTSTNLTSSRHVW